MTSRPLVDRKTRLASLLKDAPDSLQYNDHQIGHGPAFHRLACERGLEGIVSKRANGRYEPDRRTWLKIKCLNREEFVVVGWSDPEAEATDQPVAAESEALCRSFIRHRLVPGLVSP